ncbi:YueI family protein [Dellaglioa sp. P0083]|uniref:YueI family protein n=1 Tax=Dellaglioa kimchii TaxID=3344667 RepID=UPI0038D3552F
MTENNLDPHLQSGLYGTPQLHPDEQRKYLGTFRERVSLAMTVAEVTASKNMAGFEKELLEHPDYHVLLNGTIDQNILAPYITLTHKHDVKFTLTSNNDTPDGVEIMGLVVASEKNAINESVIDINEKYPIIQVEAPEKKKSFFENLFD